MAWATVARGRMHVVGGYGEGAVNRAYHHIYDPPRDRWLIGAPLPRGANHVAVASRRRRASTPSAASSSRTATPTATPTPTTSRPTAGRAIAPLPRPRGAAAAVRARRPDPPDRRRPRAGGRARQRRLARGLRPAERPLEQRARRCPAPATMSAASPHAGRIHVIGGRFNTFEYNTALHHVYLPARDTWELRAPLPTARSGHGLVVYRGRFFAMGGEGGFLERRRAAPGQGLRPDGKLRPGDRHLAAARADADAAPCGRRRRRSATGSTSPAAARCSAARCSPRCTRPSRSAEGNDRRRRRRCAGPSAALPVRVCRLGLGPAQDRDRAVATGDRASDECGAERH